MKKIIALIIMLFYISMNACYAFSELYLIKNTNVDNLNSIIKNSYLKYDYKLTKENPYFGQSVYDNSEYAVVILQQNGANTYYYYEANENNKINKAILKNFKKNGFLYEESMNANIIDVYNNLAQDIIQNKESAHNRYSFEDTPEPNINLNNKNQQQYQTSLRGAVAQIARGTMLNVYLQNAINTANANKGDQIIAVLTKDLKYNGATVFPQGSLVYGTLTKAVHATYGSRNGKVSIQFNQIVTPENKSYSISTEKIDFSVTNDGKVRSVVSSAVGGAVIGALGGLLYAALSGGDVGTAAAIGAGVGAGTGLAGAAIEQGVDAEIPSFTEMEIKLTSPVSVTISF